MIKEKKMKQSLHIPPQMWDNFRTTMLKNQSKNQEIIGFLLCERHHLSQAEIRYIPKVWLVPSSDCYEYQSQDGLVLKQAFHLYLLKTYLFRQKYHLVHIHTHTGETPPMFSAIDDQYESKYAQFLTECFSSKPRLISGVFNQSLEAGQFRIWQKKGDYAEPLSCYRQWLPLDPLLNHNQDNQLQFARQQIFGQGFQNQLEQVTVTLIGCGGIGAVFAELLARLGVKKWILIDPDRLDLTNLNRMPSATLKMVEQQWYKVHYLKGLIKKIHAYGSHVKSFPMSLQEPSLLREIPQSDLIIVATDNHSSRQLAQELALSYQLPLVCLGTHIEVKEDHQPRMYARITIPPLGGHWCLMCANIINLQQSALENACQGIQQLATDNGYLQEIPAPSVFWLNSLCASTAVGIIQGILTNLIDIKAGLDWIYYFPTSHWFKTDISYLETPNCYFCGETVKLETPLSHYP